MTSPVSNRTTPALHPDTAMGALALGVADLSRSVAFYTDVIGFELLERSTSGASLGVAGEPLLHLQEEAGAAAWPRDQRSYAGLYHFAILLPTRAALGAWLRHWLDLGLPLPGQGDHLVSEALYLEDPDGNGIEVYRDRPRGEWTWESGQIRMGTGPVDIRGLLAEAEAWHGLPAGTRIGHVHLQVGDIEHARAFYHDILGFDIVFEMPTALFISAGGYHHHLGMNTWHSLGAEPAPTGTAGLRHFTITLPSEEERNAVIDRLEAAGLPVEREPNRISARDPWGNTILLSTAG